MNTDADLKREVTAELAWEPAIDSAAIGVATKDGVVTLTGHIETFAQKHAAARAVRRVCGVKAIALELDVKLAPDHKRSDTDIALSAEHAEGWSASIGRNASGVQCDAVRRSVRHIQLQVEEACIGGI